MTDEKLAELTGNIAAIELLLAECLKLALAGQRDPDAALQAMLANLTVLKEANRQAMPEIAPGLDAAIKRVVILLASDATS